MIFRTAEPQEHLSIHEILIATCGSINAPLLFERLSTPSNTFVCEHDARIAATACFFSVSVLGKQGVFLYSLATHPDYGGDVQYELLKYAKEQLVLREVSFIVTTTCVATEQLGQLPDFHDFEPCIMFGRTTIESIPCPIPSVEFIGIDPNLISTLRAKYANGKNITFSSSAYEVFAEHWHQRNTVMAVMQSGYCVYNKHGDEVVIYESFTSDKYTLQQLVSAVAYIEEVTHVVIHLKHDSEDPAPPVRTDFGYYGMICFLGDRFETGELYMNMMFDMP